MAPVAGSLNFTCSKVGGPMVLLASGDAVRASGLSRPELGRLGYKLVIDASTPLMAAHKAWREAYAAMARGEPARRAPRRVTVGPRGPTVTATSTTGSTRRVRNLKPST